MMIIYYFNYVCFPGFFCAQKNVLGIVSSNKFIDYYKKKNRYNQYEGKTVLCISTE